MSTGRYFALMLIAVAAVLSGCGRDSNASAGPETIVVYAASSLTDAFNEIGRAFEAGHAGADVLFNFAGTAALRAQIQHGAPADVFASANQPQMALAVQEGIVSGEPRDFVTNRLVVITPAGTDTVRSLADLANAKVKLVLALPGVPVGSYAREAIEAMASSGAFGDGFAAAALANVVSEESNVRQVAAKVALGEADAGIVYRTDVTPDIAGDVSTIAIPDTFDVLATYPIARVSAAPNPEGADAFIAFVLSPDGHSILASHGFGNPAR